MSVSWVFPEQCLYSGTVCAVASQVKLFGIIVVLVDSEAMSP